MCGDRASSTCSTAACTCSHLPRCTAGAGLLAQPLASASASSTADVAFERGVLLEVADGHQSSSLGLSTISTLPSPISAVPAKPVSAGQHAFQRLEDDVAGAVEVVDQQADALVAEAHHQHRVFAVVVAGAAARPAPAGRSARAAARCARAARWSGRCLKWWMSSAGTRTVSTIRSIGTPKRRPAALDHHHVGHRHRQRQRQPDARALAALAAAVPRCR